MKTEWIDYNPGFKNTNFMTPQVREYRRGESNGLVLFFEISEGRGIDNERIFGVTVLNEDRSKNNEFSQMFHSILQVENYISLIGEENS